MKQILLAMVALISLSLTASAADVTGSWTAEVTGRGGNTQTTTFNLKADGAVLTGSVTGGRGGDQPISDGKIDGDKISFAQVLSFGGNDITITYKGVVKGDTIELTREVAGRGGPQAIVAKRVK